MRLVLSPPSSTSREPDAPTSTAITNVQSGLHWLRSTFLYTRITKNPAHYAIGPGKTSPETRLEEICLEAIKELVDSGVVDQREDELSATRASRSHSLFSRA